MYLSSSPGSEGVVAKWLMGSADFIVLEYVSARRREAVTIAGDDYGS
jgi:hypothetical protein